VSDYKIYYSSSGSYGDFTLFTGIDYTTYQAWSAARGDNEWVIKLAMIPEGTISANTIYQLYSMAMEDGLTYTTPVIVPFTSKADYGLAYSSKSEKYITASNEGIISSINGGATWALQVSQANMFQFQNLQCSGNRCVGIDFNSVVYDSADAAQTFALVTLPGVDYIQGNYPISSLNANNPSDAIFAIGSQHGIIYTSSSAGNWVSSGADTEESEDFQNCIELIVVEDVFVLNCKDQIIVSDDGMEWLPRGVYSIHGNPTLAMMAGENEALVAVAGQNVIFSSSDIGIHWTKRAEFNLYPGDFFQVVNLLRVNDQFVGLGSDRWIPIDSREEVDVPIVIKTQDIKAWNIYASNVYIYDVTYSEEMKKYFGAGKYGVFSSDNLYEWTQETSVNVGCTKIACNFGKSIVALCTNLGESTLDNLIVASSDGISWQKFISPCQTWNPQSGMVQTLHCNGLDYIDPLNGYYLYSQDPAGAIFFSQNSGSSWGLVEMPFASRIYAADYSSSGTIVTLTKSVAFSGDASGFQVASPTSAPAYTGNTTSPAKPNYAIVPGYIVTEPVDIPSSWESSGVPTSFDPQSWWSNRSTPEYDEDDGDSGGLSGGAIFGIIFAIFVFIAVIVVAIVVFVIARKKHLLSGRNEQTKLINDENDLL